MKASYKILTAVLITPVFFLMSSCYYDNELELYGTAPCDLTNVIFIDDILPVIESNCYNCHSNANAAFAGGGISLEGYNNIIQQVEVGNAGNSMLYNDIAWTPGSNHMPKGGNQLSQCEISMVEKWINDGASNN